MAMLSRIAESAYWLGRFMERAQGISISLEVQHNASLEVSEGYDSNNYQPILNAVGQLNTFLMKHDKASPENVMDYLIFDLDNPNSILSCINKARENARGIRDIISKEMWETVNVTYHEMQEYNLTKVKSEGPNSFFQFIRNKGYLFHGVTEVTMFRHTGYNFMKAGMYMERADQIARILDVKYQIPLKRVEDVGNPLDIYQWRTLLDSTGSYEAYIKNYSTKIIPIQVADLLIFNRHLPRSLYNSLEQALNAFKKITPVNDKNFANNAEQKIGKLFYDIAYTNIQEVFFFGLHEYLTNFINNLISAGIEMNYCYFGHS
jgi:uncharacterized alpha-E superfamily protein